MTEKEPVDLAEAREAKGGLTRILQEYSNARSDRTARYLSGDLEGCAEDEDEMTDDRPKTQPLRVPPDLADRADLLLDRMVEAGAPELAAAARKSRSAVLRLALYIGLSELERRYPEKD